MPLKIEVRKELITNQSISRLKKFGVLAFADDHLSQITAEILLKVSESNPEKVVVFEVDEKLFDRMKNKIKMILNNEWTELDEAMFQSKVNS